MKRRKTAESPLGKDAQATAMGANTPPARDDGAADLSAATEYQWRLPSGEDLISFALAIGFSEAPPLSGEAAEPPPLRDEAYASRRRGGKER